MVDLSVVDQSDGGIDSGVVIEVVEGFAVGVLVEVVVRGVAS